jgi:hypothetical protein
MVAVAMFLKGNLTSHVSAYYPSTRWKTSCFICNNFGYCKDIPSQKRIDLICSHLSKPALFDG